MFERKAPNKENFNNGNIPFANIENTNLSKNSNAFRFNLKPRKLASDYQVKSSIENVFLYLIYFFKG